MTDESNSPMTFALGADHGGFELKENLKAHLEGQGIAVQDYGPASDDSCDYSGLRSGGGPQRGQRPAHDGIVDL